MNAKIITNNAWRQFKYRDEVPAKVLHSQFDWMMVTDPDTGEKSFPEDDYIDGFFCYRSVWYHVADFMRCPPSLESKWDGYHGDSFYSGVLIKLSDDGEEYKVATYIS